MGDPELTDERSPRVVLGTEERFQEIKQSPGAGDYSLPRASLTGAHNPRVKLGTEQRFREPEVTPGPASYQKPVTPRGGRFSTSRRGPPRLVNSNNIGFTNSTPRFRASYLMW